MSLLKSLRTATASHHAALEQEVRVFERLDSRSDYRELLARFAGFYHPLEQELRSAADWEALGWDFERRLKTPWLLQDITALDGRTAEPIGGMSAPVLGSLAEAIGALYVIEGATLGGQQIVKALRGSDLPSRFFSSYGEATPQRWREFTVWAEGQVRGEAEICAACHAAVDTFEALTNWMGKEFV